MIELKWEQIKYGPLQGANKKNDVKNDVIDRLDMDRLVVRISHGFHDSFG